MYTAHLVTRRSVWNYCHPDQMTWIHVGLLRLVSLVILAPVHCWIERIDAFRRPPPKWDSLDFYKKIRLYSSVIVPWALGNQHRIAGISRATLFMEQLWKVEGEINENPHNNCVKIVKIGLTQSTNIFIMIPYMQNSLTGDHQIDETLRATAVSVMYQWLRAI